MRFDGAGSPADRLMGAEGQGFKIALAALDGGRLGIAACAVGLAQAALDAALGLRPAAPAVRPRRSSSSRGWRSCSPTWPPRSRRRARCTWPRPGAGTPGEPFGQQAAMAKLFCTDTAMRVTTDAVQVLGGYGYVEDFPVERYMREAKVAADRRGHQPDPAHGDRPAPRQVLSPPPPGSSPGPPPTIALSASRQTTGRGRDTVIPAAHTDLHGASRAGTEKTRSPRQSGE